MYNLYISNEDIFKIIVLFIILVIAFKLFIHNEGFCKGYLNTCNNNSDCCSNRKCKTTSNGKRYCA